ncbi:MAG: extracellular solute-binding protein, family 3 [Proteobacteria bacterium]|nr:extracellular solute-binding protein, family 3 [Pseudomonadota bacterium]
MSRLCRTLFLVCLTLSWGQAISRELKIVFFQYTPPYVFENGGGIVVDIVRAALEPAGYQISPVYLPIGRGSDLFAKKRVDGTTIIREDSRLVTNYSDDLMQYPNRAFALKTAKLSIKSVADLKDRSIVAFQDAHKYLGDEFARVVSSDRHYQEISNQEKQVLLLLQGQVEVAVMDENIFRFYREKLIAEGKIERSVEVDIFPLFPPTPFKAAFIDPKVRDDFNRGLATLRRDGRYNATYRKYIEEYFSAKR